MSACRSCHAEIEWALTRQGNKVPLDVEENPAGNIVIEADGVVAYLPPGSNYTGPRRISHFATCPDREQWRNKRR